ncbi:MAG: type II toxin-antitoxin system VapC family toxin [Acidimicrobiia bacterium]|nr:type II toxin-antitoxin system VapC family toxin [Acidimicrobiia bacterium]
MRFVDVNVLVDAHRPESTKHPQVSMWLERARRGREPLGLPSVVASGFIRIVTHPRVFKEPSPVEVALSFVDGLLASPAVVPVMIGDRHWAIFRDLCSRYTLTGNDIPDAYLAALAIEQGATWVTSDRGFERFPSLRVEHPAG